MAVTNFVVNFIAEEVSINVEVLRIFLSDEGSDNHTRYLLKSITRAQRLL